MDPAPSSPLVAESFNRDPRWEELRSVPLPATPHRVRQRLGWSAATLPGAASPGQIGGRVQRSLVPASFALPITVRSLRGPLRFAGKVGVTASEGASGVLFGFFHSSSRGWRTPNSLVVRLDGGDGNFRVFFEYGTMDGLTGCMGCFEGERYQTTPTPPSKADGALHRFALDYDPNAAGGRGQIACTLDGRVWRLDLGEGDREDGALFDRFGILNQQATGGALELAFADLEVDGLPVDLSVAGRWQGRGEQAEHDERALRPHNDWGWRESNEAGGRSGELGGIIWRDERPAYLARAIEPLSLDEPLSVEGRIALAGAAADSAVSLGWFSAEAKRAKATPEFEAPQAELLALLIEGPSRVGHYLRPISRDREGRGAGLDSGPRLRADGRPHRFSLRYDPNGAGGLGRIEYSLDDEHGTLDLAPGQRARGARLDRFGLFNFQTGGLWLEVYVDDLVFTARSAR